MSFLLPTPCCACFCEVHLQCLRDVIFQLYWTHKSYLMSNKTLSSLLFSWTQTWLRFVRARIWDIGLVLCLSTHLLLPWIVLSGDPLKDSCSRRTEYLMVCFRGKDMSKWDTLQWNYAPEPVRAKEPSPSFWSNSRGVSRDSDTWWQSLTWHAT